MDLKKEINKLENVHLMKPEKVFTMYLNTDPADPDQQGGEWKIHLKNGLNNFEHYLQEDGDSDEKRNYWAVKEKVQNYIDENEQHFGKSVVIIASADETVWFAERFQMPVETAFYWEEQPVVDQLKEMYKQFPKTGIILTQKENIKLIDAELAQLKDTKVYELDLNTEDWRLHQGGHASGASTGSGGAKQSKSDQYNERFEANRYRWYKSIAPKLDKQAKEHGWEQIIMVGDKEEVDDLRDNMNKEVDKIVNKNLLDHEEMKVINQIVYEE
ncbi:VLRF1 family aeRF1-type release factor [Salimicrobium album]|uniref:Protein required for attachment to host cells n=1 Tax=Salimicrobium album TaxID=50717 RepID=A0A1H3G987_9BACI|nr:VLRF1 family aeRF1-type release factor [Salimicrobium album]SDX99846.1 Protein required for attachment to host cells [Salimicrobium album]